MTDEEPFFKCLDCEAEFNVVWVNRGTNEAPRYCPFCACDGIELELEAGGWSGDE